MNCKNFIRTESCNWNQKRLMVVVLSAVIFFFRKYCVQLTQNYKRALRGFVFTYKDTVGWAFYGQLLWRIFFQSTKIAFVKIFHMCNINKYSSGEKCLESWIFYIINIMAFYTFSKKLPFHSSTYNIYQQLMTNCFSASLTSHSGTYTWTLVLFGWNW